LISRAHRGYGKNDRGEFKRKKRTRCERRKIEVWGKAEFGRVILVIFERHLGVRELERGGEGGEHWK